MLERVLNVTCGVAGDASATENVDVENVKGQLLKLVSKKYLGATVCPPYLLDRGNIYVENSPLRKR